MTRGNKLKQGGGIQTATLGGPAALGTVKVPGCFYVQTPQKYMPKLLDEKKVI